MRQAKGLLERVYDWAQDYGWGIPVFGIGLLFGMAVVFVFEVGSSWLQTITALGTLGAAFAAFWSVNFSRRVQRQRNNQEDNLRQPRLKVISAWLCDDFTLCFRLVNLGAETVFVSKIGRDLIPPAGGIREAVDAMLKSGESLDVSITSSGSWNVPADNTQPRIPCYCFMFFSGSLGPILHRLSLPITIREEDDLIVFEYDDQTITVEEHQQQLGIGLLMPSESLKAIHRMSKL